jgi:hypothetical protein
MNCRICGGPIKLVPSASERARKYGETPMFYTGLFKEHTACFLEERKADTLKLVKETNRSAMKR